MGDGVAFFEGAVGDWFELRVKVVKVWCESVRVYLHRGRIFVNKIV